MTNGHAKEEPACSARSCRWSIPAAALDLDLYDAKIVTNISGRTAMTRKRLANGLETRAFLDAALDLTTELFTPALSEQLLDADEEDARPVMSYLSRRKVLAKARKNCGDDFPLSENMMRHRWSTHGGLSGGLRVLCTGGQALEPSGRALAACQGSVDLGR